jgi:hypothetical protein
MQASVRLAQATDCITPVVRLSQLRGQVFSLGDTPYADAVVEATGSRNYGSVKADAKGRFAINGLGDGKYSLAICDPDGQRCNHVTLFVAPDRDRPPQAVIIEKSECPRVCTLPAGALPVGSKLACLGGP